MVRALLQHPLIDPNKAMGGYPETALYYAADHAEIDYVRLLIAHPKTDVNKGRSDGRTPLIRLKLGIHNLSQLFYELGSKNLTYNNIE